MIILQCCPEFVAKATSWRSLHSPCCRTNFVNMAGLTHKFPKTLNNRNIIWKVIHALRVGYSNEQVGLYLTPVRSILKGMVVIPQSVHWVPLHRAAANYMLLVTVWHHDPRVDFADFFISGKLTLARIKQTVEISKLRIGLVWIGRAICHYGYSRKMGSRLGCGHRRGYGWELFAQEGHRQVHVWQSHWWLCLGTDPLHWWWRRNIQRLFKESSKGTRIQCELIGTEWGWTTPSHNNHLLTRTFLLAFLFTILFLVLDWKVSFSSWLRKGYAMLRMCARANKRFLFCNGISVQLVPLWRLPIFFFSLA